MTRRITLNPRIGNQFTLDWNNNWIVVKEGTDIKEFKGEKQIVNNRGYTSEQLNAISEVNSVLEQNSQSVMTDEEIEYFLYPFGKETKVNPEEYQKLAGFEVHKTIKYEGEIE